MSAEPPSTSWVSSKWVKLKFWLNYPFNQRCGVYIDNLRVFSCQWVHVLWTNCPISSSLWLSPAVTLTPLRADSPRSSQSLSSSSYAAVLISALRSVLPRWKAAAGQAAFSGVSVTSVLKIEIKQKPAKQWCGKAFRLTARGSPAVDYLKTAAHTLVQAAKKQHNRCVLSRGTCFPLITQHMHTHVHIMHSA